MIFHYSLGTDFLLNLPEPIGEVCPQISSLRKISRDNILAGGSVCHSFNDPMTWFVCLLDGDTGKPLWKTTGCALGSAVVIDVIETSSGLIVAVGVTMRIIMLEDHDYPVLDQNMPFIVVLDSAGELQELVVCDIDLADVFYSIIETNPLENEFLITGEDIASNQQVLLRATISSGLQDLNNSVVSVQR
ncbi:MAG: hypothetical protein K8S24_03600 [Candidatus Aegiribacteria sp.]|nr:hypothetical protein [Candidatus Aegiribacteria sp.]